MTKTEAAAYDYMRKHRFAEGPRAIDAFVAGARWALEQMTSEAVLRAVKEAADGLPLSYALAAVRKEIEG